VRGVLSNLAASSTALLLLAQACSLLVDTRGLTGDEARRADLDAGSVGASLDGSPGLTADADAPALAEGLLAFYPLDESSGTAVADRSGRGNTGILTGDPATVWGAGKIGNSFHGDGKTTYITLPKKPGGIELGIGDFTIAAWVMVSGALADGASVPGVQRSQQWFLTLSTGECCQRSNYPSVRMGWWYDAFALLLGDLYDGGPDDAGDYGHIFGVTHKLPEAPGVWHHITGVRRANEVALFIDGVYIKGEVAKFLANLHHPTAPFVLGRFDDEFFLGAIDEVRIYGRGLTDQEIAELYRIGE
jgi:hypothetical protein